MSFIPVTQWLSERTEEGEIGSENDSRSLADVRYTFTGIAYTIAVRVK